MNDLCTYCLEQLVIPYSIKPTPVTALSVGSFNTSLVISYNNDPTLVKGHNEEPFDKLVALQSSGVSLGEWFLTF